MRITLAPMINSMWHSDKEATCQCRYEFDPWVRKIPWRWSWQPTPVFLPEKSHEQRNLGGYSPWGHKELGMIERLSIYAQLDSIIGAQVFDTNTTACACEDVFGSDWHLCWESK